MWVEVQDRFYRLSDGRIWRERYINGVRVEQGPSPVVFVDWSYLESVWTTMVKRSTALVKEGPKAIVLYRGGIRDEGSRNRHGDDRPFGCG